MQPLSQSYFAVKRKGRPSRDSSRARSTCTTSHTLWLRFEFVKCYVPFPSFSSVFLIHRNCTRFRNYKAATFLRADALALNRPQVTFLNPLDEKFPHVVAKTLLADSFIRNKIPRELLRNLRSLICTEIGRRLFFLRLRLLKHSFLVSKGPMKRSLARLSSLWQDLALFGKT